MRATALFGLVLCGTLAAGTATLRGALPQASDAVMLQQGVSLRAGAGVAAGDIGGKMQALEAKIRAELAHAQHAEEEHKRQAEAVLGRVREAVAALEKEDDAAHNQVVLLEAQVAPLEAEDASMLQRIKDAEHAADEKREQITRGQQERNAEAAQFAHVREELVESIAQTQQLEEAIQSALSHAAVADAVSHAQQDGVVALLQVGAERRDSATLHRLALLARSGFKAAQEGNSETVQQMVELLHRLRSSLRASLEEQEAREERAKEAWQHIMADLQREIHALVERKASLLHQRTLVQHRLETLKDKLGDARNLRHTVQERLHAERGVLAQREREVEEQGQLLATALEHRRDQLASLTDLQGLLEERQQELEAERERLRLAAATGSTGATGVTGATGAWQDESDATGSAAATGPAF